LISDIVYLCGKYNITTSEGVLHGKGIGIIMATGESDVATFNIIFNILLVIFS
jgi:hypothetical protein